MDSIVDSYKKQLVFTKSCAYNVNTCYWESTWKLLNNTTSYWNSFTGGRAYYNILLDGTYVKFYKCPQVSNPGCDVGQVVSTGLTSLMEIIVNINGEKPPNVVGRDVFFFVLTPQKGLIAPDAAIMGRCAGLGLTCSTRILQEGAVNY